MDGWGSYPRPICTHIQYRLGKNATLDKMVKEWVKDTVRASINHPQTQARATHHSQQLTTYTHAYIHPLSNQIKPKWRWGEPALNPSVALTWVNGINYTSAEVEEQAHFLSTLFGCRVRIQLAAVQPRAPRNSK